MLLDEMKALRESAGLSYRSVGRALDISGEAYRQKELGNIGITGAELAKLARLYGRTLPDAFPSYEPTEGEILLAHDLNAAA